MMKEKMRGAWEEGGTGEGEDETTGGDDQRRGSLLAGQNLGCRSSNRPNPLYKDSELLETASAAFSHFIRAAVKEFHTAPTPTAPLCSAIRRAAKRELG